MEGMDVRCASQVMYGRVCGGKRRVEKVFTKSKRRRRSRRIPGGSARIT